MNKLGEIWSTVKGPTSKLAGWLMAPGRQGWLLLVVGMAAWFLTWNLTRWNAQTGWQSAAQIFVDTYLICLAVCLLPKKVRRVVLVVIYVIIYVLGFCESFLYQRFLMHITPQTLFMIQETTPDETSGFFSVCFDSPALWKTALWWCLLLIVHIGLLIGSRLLARRWPEVVKHVRRWAPALFVPLCLTCCVWWWPARVKVCEFLALQRTDMAERADEKVFCSPEWRVVYAAKFVQLANVELETLSYNMLHLPEVKSDSGVPVIVWVIGESHNKHHSAVYGYGLPTTPFQSQSERDGLMVAMQDAVSPWNVTSNVFKQILSTHSSDQPGLWTDGVLFPALIRKAGYEVSFHTAQFYKSPSQNVAYFNGSFFLNGQPYDSLCFDKRNARMTKFDLELLDNLEAPSRQPQFVILHLMGQHLPYNQRFPKTSAFFTKDDIDRSDLQDKQRQTVADYDNATLYNDSVLMAIYDHFKDQQAVIVYTADHGDEVYDGKMKMFGRNHKAQPTADILWAEFEVPLEVWVTPGLQQARPSLMQQLRAARDKAFSTDDLCHMFLHLAGVATKYYDPKRDILSPVFAPRPRPIKGTQRTYDDIMKGASQTPNSTSGK